MIVASKLSYLSKRKDSTTPKADAVSQWVYCCHTSPNERILQHEESQSFQMKHSRCHTSPNERILQPYITAGQIMKTKNVVIPLQTKGFYNIIIFNALQKALKYCLYISSWLSLNHIIEILSSQIHIIFYTKAWQLSLQIFPTTLIIKKLNIQNTFENKLLIHENTNILENPF